MCYFDWYAFETDFDDMKILRFRCHSCAHVTEIDMDLCTDELQAECSWCGRQHDGSAIRLTRVTDTDHDAVVYDGNDHKRIVSPSTATEQLYTRVNGDWVPESPRRSKEAL